MFLILETSNIFDTLNKVTLNEMFLEEVDKFISGLDRKTVKKIFYNIDVAY